MAGQFPASYNLTFPTEKMRQDFEIAFSAFVKEFQRQNEVYYTLQGLAGTSGGEVNPGGGGGSSSGQGGLVGSQGGQGGGQGGDPRGLISIKTAEGSAYLNFF